MSRFNFIDIALSDSADATTIDENFEKIEENAVLKTDTATTSAAGLMSASDKTKLNGIATGADKTTVDSALSSSSTNPVQNKIINTALGNKVDKVAGKGLSTNDYTTAEKNKLAGIDMSTKVNKSGDIMTGTLSFGDAGNGQTVIKAGNIQMGLTNTINGASMAIGDGCTAGTSRFSNSLCVGCDNTANGSIMSNPAITLGSNLTADVGQLTIGRYNKDTDASDAYFLIGNGNSSSRSNAFRVTSSGAVYANSTYHSSGADYAETTEWLDGNPNNEDRIGKFVCMVGEKMRIANSSDSRNRLGIISAKPAVNGDSYSENWKGKYKTDIFGRELFQKVTHKAITDENGDVISEAYETNELILADNYDPTREYIPREKRKEFDYFGMLGKLVVIDDGTCQEDGYCFPNNDGIATNENDSNKGFYVMKRLDENHIKVLLK